ncbi:MAG: type II CAAX endopeptidase family protein [Mizugakiibacter sp.]|uniref:CPBP family intramembrane glutamic endopeptidase n=1 Tax=Mizugakiibacter sp. TaxID=1972610 RepID=UPI0031C9A38D|nr:CPBP family intramembrane metalloprotease [Xanthomonadaceae bacterium]
MDLAGVETAPAGARAASGLWQFAVIGAVLATAWFAPGWGSIYGAAVALLIARFEPRRWHVPLGLLKRTDWRRVVLFGLLAGVAQLLLAKILLTPAVEALTGQHRDLRMFDALRGNVGALLGLLPTMWLSAGLCEEIVFRGIALGRLRAALGGTRLATAVAFVASCIVFGLAHGYQGLSGWIITGVMGSVLALVYVVSGYRLWYGIALHLVYDTLATACIAFNIDRVFAAWGARLFHG